MGRFAVGFQAFRSVAIGTATYAVGAALKLLPSLGVWMYLGLGVVVFACAAIDALATGVRPAVRLREIAPLAMDAAAAPIVAAFTAHGIAVRMNLLLARGSWRRLWCDRFFPMAGNIGMTVSPDVNIFFPIQAGIAGRCYASRRPVVAGPEDIARFPLPARYRRNGVDGLSDTAILCYPVYEPAREGLQSGKVIGVLTLDSLNPGALPIIQDGGMVAPLAPHLPDPRGSRRPDLSVNRTMNDPRNPTPEPVALTRQEDGLLTFPIEPPAYLSVEAFRAEFRKNLAVAPSGDQPPPA